jgi:hypothetical protein
MLSYGRGRLMRRKNREIVYGNPWRQLKKGRRLVHDMPSGKGMGQGASINELQLAAHGNTMGYAG